MPADDPLHPGSDIAVGGPNAAERQLRTAVAPTRAASVLAALPDRILKAFREHGGASLMPEEADVHPLPPPTPDTIVRADGGIVVDASRKVSVPAFDGVGLRQVLERAAVANLRVQPVGSGLAREQVPAAGTMVPTGTEVVVRFTR